MRGLRFYIVILVCAAALAVEGCGEKDLTKPPKIHYGRDTCSQCRMILGEERFACAAVSKDGQFFKFDDIGCLAAYEKNKSGETLRSWVHEANALGWIEKENAYFVYSKDEVTPMGYGFVAFADAETAEKFAKEKLGRTVSWNDLKKEGLK